MREFFHGWKRKTGAVTLVMALAIMVLWLRSHVLCDEVILGTSTSFHQISIYCGSLVSIRRSGRFEGEEFDRFAYFTRPANTTPQFQVDEFLSMNIHGDYANRVRENSTIRFCGAEFIDGYWWGISSPMHIGLPPGDGRYAKYIVALWTVASPLTLLSAWLLLSKQRMPVLRSSR